MPKTRDDSDDEYYDESDEIDDDDDEYMYTYTQTYIHTHIQHTHTYIQYVCTAVNCSAALLFVQSSCRKNDLNAELPLWAA